jgi:hypothetical protein
MAQPTQEQQNALRSNCRSDFMSNCSSVRPGGVEALQCLQRNAAKLSPGCQNAVNALTPKSAPQQATAVPATAPIAAPTTAARPAAMPSVESPAAPAQASAQPQQQAVRATAVAPAAAPAAAQRQPTSQQQAAIRQSCQGDFMSRCSGVQPGGADALRCLQRNSTQLSPNCRRAVAALGGAPAARPAPTLASAPPAGPAAAPVASPTPQQQNAIRFTCRRDFVVNCRGVTPGGPEAFACLQRHSARLSPDCRTSLAAFADGAPVADAAPIAAAPAARPGPVGPLRRAIRERMMNR